jgi:hypothetical protein
VEQQIIQQQKETVIMETIKKSRVRRYLNEHQADVIAILVGVTGGLIIGSYVMGKNSKADLRILQGELEFLKGKEALAMARALSSRVKYQHLFDEVARGDNFVYDAAKRELVNITKNAAIGITS